jgi:hypothetical protein
MRADPEPHDLVTFQEPEGAVSQCHADRVNRLASVDLLKLQARMLGVLAKEPIRFPSRFLNLSWQVAIRRPEASRGMSQLVGVEFRRSAGTKVSPSLGGELAQSIL